MYLKKEMEKYTITDYYNLPEEKHVELLDGVFYNKAAPSIIHQRIIGDLYNQISNYIREKGGDCIPMISPVDVQLDQDEYTMVQPDLMIVCDPEKIADTRVEGVPDFVLEVVSPSSGAKDYVKKVAKYMAAGVREYWIIDPVKKRVMVYDFENDGVPYIQGLEGTLGIRIYEDDLQISFDEIEKLINS